MPPFWLIIPVDAWSIGRGVGNPPSVDTTYSGEPHGYVARTEENTTPFPSGVQFTTLSAPLCHVSCFGSPPATGITNTSLLPMRLLEKAIHLPSGEKRGFMSR